MRTEQHCTARPTPAEITSSLSPFIGRRLRGIWRSLDVQSGAIDLCLAFGERPDAPDAVRLTTTPIIILPAWVEGGGPTTPALRAELVDSLAENPGASWYPFPEPGADGAAPFRDWALTEIWLSHVVANIAAPGGFCIQEVCGGLALHFSNAHGPNRYGRLLGMTQEHHDLDVLPSIFCDEALPSLIGSGPWRRTAALKEDTQLDDSEVRHFSPHDFGTPALAGCTERLRDALHAFCRWFEHEPRTGWLANASTKRWLAHHRHHLDKVTSIHFNADLILRRSTECGEDLKHEMAALGLGTLFSEHWPARDAADDADRMPLPKPALLTEIRRHYAPVREAYRQWFVLFRRACTDEQRRLVRWTYEPTPEWALTLDAALTRGSLRLETLLEIPGAHWLRDDFRTPWEPCKDCAWWLEQGGLSHCGPQDVLIEGDEEQAGSLRITWWPVPERRDRIVAIRVPRDVLIDWWQQRSRQDLPSPFEAMLAFAANRPLQPEYWPAFPELLSRVAHPPGFDAERITLPPYTEDDIRDVFLQRMQGRPAKDWPGVRGGMPEIIWAYDSRLHWIPMLVGCDVHPLSPWSPLHAPTEKVVFPSVWPASWVGRGPFYLLNPCSLQRVPAPRAPAHDSSAA